jgi:hypothetical protein
VIVALAGCTATAPTVETPPDTSREMGRVFADTVIATTKGGQVTMCLDTVPTCGTPRTGPCANNPAVGPNDGMTYDLGMLGRIELGFVCSAIVERGGGMMESSDFKIWSTLASGAKAIVEVSKDGSQYITVAYLEMSDQTFSLQRAGISEARFVRITDFGAGGVQIDAVEAL